MPDTTTTVLGLTKPEVAGSADTWGGKLNTNEDLVDALFDAGPVLKLTKGGTGANTAGGARAALGLGTMAQQSSAAVAITGGTLAGMTSIAASGLIHSSVSGIKFPDNTIQLTAAVGGGGGSGFTWSTKSVNFTTGANNGYFVDTASVVATLQADPAGTEIRFVSGLASGSFTINPDGADTIMGAASLVVDVAYASFTLVKIGTDWRVF